MSLVSACCCSALRHWAGFLVVAGLLLEILSLGTCQAQAADAAPPVRFGTEVVPLLTRLGCNGGGCHGKATGQNGFRLSLLGFEPELDHRAIVREARGRRISLAAPEQSLLIRKALGAVPHGGGKRLDEDSADYVTLVRWIAGGAPPAAATDPVVQGLRVLPEKQVFQAGAQPLRLQVEARLSDGSRRDVTEQAVYQTNEPEVAEVDERGQITIRGRSGLFAVMVRFGEEFAVFHGVVPVPGTSAGQTPTAAVSSAPSRPQPPAGEKDSRAAVSQAVAEVDQCLADQWRRLGVEPSLLVDDAAFLRRASLDILGTLPTPAEVREFVSDARPDKRAIWIDRLLDRPEYASYFALKWGDILRNRGRGYATSKQRPGTALFAAWIRDCFAANLPYDQFVTEILTASGSQETNPPTVWYRTVRTSQDYVESVAQAFLGVRIQCAQCHHHPAEKWSQDDYFGLAAVFGRVGRKGGFADAEVPTNEVIYLADAASVRHPRTGALVAPRALGGPAWPLASPTDPRAEFARWLTAKDNPFFARTMANRMWAHFCGRGIIHPLDDARSSNPPSNPELLDALARDFAARGYDVKHLIRVICSSAAYQRDSLPTATNRDDLQTFARYYPKRMGAEVLLDAISQVLEVPSRFPNVAGDFPPGTRAIELPDEAVPSHFLDVFGRPARNTACECERVDAPALGQTLELVASAEIQGKLTADQGLVHRLSRENGSVDENLSEIFLRVFSRLPTSAERDAAQTYLASRTEKRAAYQSLLWSLLATNEFLFQH